MIKGDYEKYTDCSAGVKLFPLAYNFQITTTNRSSLYELGFYQKPRKPIMITAISLKSFAQGHAQLTRDTTFHNLSVHSHE